MDLSGKVTIITGGASGIGKAIAEGCAEAGARAVVIADPNRNEADRAAEEIGARTKAKVLSIPTDVTDEKQVTELVERTVADFGAVDILVNNAGICPVVDWDDTDLASWNEIMNINLTSMFICTKAVVPHMRAKHYGRILYISSMGGLVGSFIAHVGYGVSKAGVIALMKSVAKGFADDGILANAICPGSIDTPLTNSFGEEMKESFADACFLKRQGTPRELADAAIFLVSDKSTYITGAVLQVSGGRLII